MKKLSIFTIMTILVTSLSLFSAVSLVWASSPTINKPGVAQDKMGNMEIQKKAKPGTGIDKMGNMDIQKKATPENMKKKGNLKIQKDAASENEGGVRKEFLEGK